MSNRSLVNFNNSNSFLGYPIADSPTDNTALFFVNGEFFFATISESGGIVGVLSLGGGASIFKAIAGGILELRSIIGTSNISVQQLTDNISIGLSQFLTGIKKITFANDINLEEATDDLNFNITDEGASILKNLYFRTKYGVLSSVAMSINNQARIDIYGPTFLNNIVDGTPDSDKYLALDNTGKIIKATVTDVTNAVNVPGTNYKWFMGKVGNNLEFRSFTNGLNINIGILGGEILFSLPTVLNEVTQINPNIPNSPGATVYDPNNADFRIGSENIYLDNFELGDTNKYLSIDNNQLRKSYAIELLESSGVGTGLIKGQFGYAYRLKSLIAGSNVTITSTTDEITINSTGGGGGVNIFNSDGQSTSSQRIFNGFTPGSVNNKITFNDVNLGLTNSLPYDSSYLGNIETPNILAFADGGNYSKFINAPYSFQSLKVDVNVGAAYGSTHQFYQSQGDAANGNLSWIFEIDVYENVIGRASAFVAKYEFNCNSALTTPKTYYIKPICTSNLNSANPQNFIGLEAWNQVVGPNKTWILALIQLGIGLPTVASTFTVFVKDLGKGNKIVNTFGGAGSITVPATIYLNPYEMIYSSGIGFPPALLTTYRCPGKDIRITIFAQMTNPTANTSGTFAIRFNGVNVYQLNFRNAGGGGGTYGIINGSRTFKMIDLINIGALTLGTTLTITYFMTGAGYNGVNQPYEIKYEYV